MGYDKSYYDNTIKEYDNNTIEVCYCSTVTLHTTQDGQSCLAVLSASTTDTNIKLAIDIESMAENVKSRGACLQIP